VSDVDRYRPIVEVYESASVEGDCFCLAVTLVGRDVAALAEQFDATRRGADVLRGEVDGDVVLLQDAAVTVKVGISTPPTR
jgi:hypothetical protein